MNRRFSSQKTRKNTKNKIAGNVPRIRHLLERPRSTFPPPRGSQKPRFSGFLHISVATKYNFAHKKNIFYVRTIKYKIKFILNHFSFTKRKVLEWYAFHHTFFYSSYKKYRKDFHTDNIPCCKESHRVIIWEIKL